MVSSPGNQSDLPTSPGEVFVLCFYVGVVVTSCVACKYLVILSTSDYPLVKVRASPDTEHTMHILFIEGVYTECTFDPILLGRRSKPIPSTICRISECVNI